VAGHLADRFGRKIIACLGLAIFGTSTILMVLADSIPSLVAFRIFQGIGLGLFGPSILGAVAGLEEAGRSFAEFRTAQVTAFIIGPLLGGFLADVSFDLPLILASIGAFSSILPLVWAEEAACKEDVHLASIRELFKDRPLLTICLSGFLAECVFASFDIVIPTLGFWAGWSMKETGEVLSSYFISFVLTQIPLGRLADRFGKRKVVTLCLTSSAISLLMLKSTRPMIFALEMGAFGMTLGGVFVQSTAMVGDLAPEGSRSLYMALFDSLIDLSFLVAPGISTLFLALDLRANFVLWTTLFLLAVLLLCLVEDSE